MRIVLIAFFVIATLSSCRGGDSDSTQAPPDANVYVIKSRAAVQCTTPAMSLETLERQLTDAGIQTTTGQIGIFMMLQTQLPKALAAGFVLKSSAPDAKESDC